MFLKIAFSVGFAFIVSASAFAMKYERRSMNGGDLRYTIDAKLEDDFRTYLTRNAKKNIRVLTFDQRADEAIGMPLLKELGKAAEAGIQVEFISTWVGRAVLDPYGWSSRYIRFLSEKYPKQDGRRGYFQGIVAGGLPMKKLGWNFPDGPHIKLFIIDDRIAIITGRGHAGTYLRWLDTAFFFKGPLVKDSVRAFQDVWETLLIENRPDTLFEWNYFPMTATVAKFVNWRRGQSSENPVRATLEQQEEFWRDVPSRANPWLDDNHPELLELKRWSNDADLEPGTNPIHAQLLHNRFLEQMKMLPKRPTDYSLEERQKHVTDEILENAIRAVQNARTKIRFFTFAIIMHPRFKAELLEAARRGVSIQILTNSRDAQSKNIFDSSYRVTSGLCPISLAAGYYIGLKDMAELMRAGIRVFALRVTPEYEFLHRKVLNVDDEVFFGSHNLTIPSTTLQEEINIQVSDPVLANWVQQEFIRSTSQAYSDELDHVEVIKEANATLLKCQLSGVKQAVSNYFMFMY
jgi:putative cardiolipin synthase